MKLWIGGELEIDLADIFREARKVVEKSVNDAIGKNSYLDAPHSWDCIAILRKDDAFEESYKFSKKSGEMDFRLKLNYSKFKQSESAVREKMIFEMLWRSLSILREKGLTGEGMDKLSIDVLKIGRTHGWA